MRYLYMFLCLFFCACYVPEQKSIVSLTKEWSGKKLVFPESFVLNAYLGDSVVNYNKVQIQQYAILVYTDSIGCMSCKMNLPGWTDFLLELDFISKKTVPCLFIFNPKSDGKGQLVNLLKQTHFSYPVYIDKKDSFNILNKFPKDERFQTFLLNSDNKVLAIGSPIHNPKIKELYLNIIQGKDLQLNATNSTSQTSVSVDNVSVSLDHFNWQEEQKTSFMIKNAGNKPLIIQDVNTSCGCTTVSYSQEPVQPGKEIKLDITYKADHPEHFSKTITVYCNTESSPIRLTISGDAK